MELVSNRTDHVEYVKFESVDAFNSIATNAGVSATELASMGDSPSCAHQQLRITLLRQGLRGHGRFYAYAASKRERAY